MLTPIDKPFMPKIHVVGSDKTPKKEIKKWKDENKRRYWYKHHEENLRRSREYKLKHKKEIAEYDRRKYLEFKKIKDSLKEHGCCICGNTKFNVFHHINPDETDNSWQFSGMGWKKNEEILEEFHKCMILCRSCHRTMHNIMSDHEPKIHVIGSETIPGKKYYVMNYLRGQWRCTCEDFVFRGRDLNGRRNKHLCKHIRLVMGAADDIFVQTIKLRKEEGE